MIIYIDITQLNMSRANTGIQRVVKEFIYRVDSTKGVSYNIVAYNFQKDCLEKIDNKEIKPFLDNIKTYKFKNLEKIDLESMIPTSPTAFFDMDSVWNTHIQRKDLYPKLKKNGFLIFNFIYDLVPIVMSQYAFISTVEKFKPFMNAVCEYSDMVFFDSISAQNDFFAYKKTLEVGREIPTRVFDLGSNFIQKDVTIKSDVIKNLLNKKFILFVGTIEPRKCQEEVLNAFNVLSQKYDDLHLVFVGKEGWNVDKLIKNINENPLKGKRLFWFDNVDDDTLNVFYQNAFLVTYISKYEGYGLPIAEALSFGNITITSKNSSMYEVGRNFADYTQYNSENELVDIISLYYENQDFYNEKKAYIAQNYKSNSWSRFFSEINGVFENMKTSYELRKNHLEKFQFVFISIDLEKLQGTIKETDKYIDYVKEYIVVTSPQKVEEAKKLTSKRPIHVIDENKLLGEYKEDFQKRDHQSKNWLLRASLLNLESLEEEFIMLDDDNRPLKTIEKDFFITKDGLYNAYYFYNLLQWHQKTSDYDIGQHNTKDVLTDKKLELFSYSSHAPQIINKSFFKEVVEEFFTVGLEKPIDEWSVYFNYSISKYPYSFNKKIFETLNWPDSLYHWEHIYKPEKFSFENYYTDNAFAKNSNYEDKIAIKTSEITPFYKTKEIFENNKNIFALQNMVHGVCSFSNDDFDLYLSCIPYFLIVNQNADVKLPINYKLLNKTKEIKELEVCICLNGKIRTFVKLDFNKNFTYQEEIVDIPFLSMNLANQIYEMSIDVKVDGKLMYSANSPYIIKLIVDEKNIFKYNETKVETNQMSIKEKIKNIPLLGWFSRWIYNVLKLNNLKHSVFMQGQEIQRMQKNLAIKQEQINKLLQERDEINIKLTRFEENFEKKIAKEIFYQSMSFQQRIDQFLFDANTKLDNKPIDKKILSNLSQDYIDKYYLAFENKFRGSRENILDRSREYLKYFDKTKVKKALDLGCGRGEWLEVLISEGIEVIGLDSNSHMIEEAKKMGIENVYNQDAFEFLKNAETNSYDLVTSFHVIEHLEFEDLLLFFAEIKRVLKPSGVALFETPNPENMLVSSLTFYKDPTHKNPLPAEVTQFMLEYVGFKDTKVQPLHPFPNEMKIDENSKVANTLNTYLYREQDYLVIVKNDVI